MFLRKHEAGVIFQTLLIESLTNYLNMFWLYLTHFRLLFHFYTPFKITDEKFILISCLFQKLSVIQFYQVLYGNYWDFEMLDREVANISRIINGKSMKFTKHLSNRNILKVAKFGVHSTYRF